ncbi:YrvL family regulatory protein [Oceanobacillus senegalensis]|uniref:YrvL family regulatory protein n=1 Tax=Oceanobacillus senegalensis TaxID=1936063 RepID=UPI000A30C52F|nr:YrvL family regulatory protein [Oceanobacillus senegalensis]
MRKRDHSFRKMRIGGKLVVVTSIGLLVMGAFLLVVAAYFFGFVGVFNVFNVQYESLGTLFLFLIFFFILGFFTNLFAQASIIISTAYYKEKKKIITLKIMFETLFLWLAIFIVDEMMVRITVPVETELIVSLILACSNLIFDGKKKIRIKIRRKK